MSRPSELSQWRSSPAQKCPPDSGEQDDPRLAGLLDLLDLLGQSPGQCRGERVAAGRAVERQPVDGAAGLGEELVGHTNLVLGVCPARFFPAGGFRIVLYDEAGVSHPRVPCPVHQPRLQPGLLVRPDPTAPGIRRRRRRRALVVDDEPTIRSALVRYLRRRGWQADEAEDGKAALRKLGRAATGRI